MSSFFYRPRRGGLDNIDVEIPNIDVDQEIRKIRGQMPILLVAGLVLLLFFLAQALPSFYTDYLWFPEHGPGQRLHHTHHCQF